MSSYVDFEINEKLKQTTLSRISLEDKKLFYNIHKQNIPHNWFLKFSSIWEHIYNNKLKKY